MDIPTPGQKIAENEHLDRETARRSSDSFPEPSDDREAELESANADMNKTLEGYENASEVTAPDKSKSLNFSQRIRQLFGRE
jgi:hypothetical protein